MVSPFRKLLKEAINYFLTYGYTPEGLAVWQDMLRSAASKSMPSEQVLNKKLSDSLQGTFKRLVTNGSVMKYHPGIPRLTLERIAPQLRNELDRRIFASADLIKINRDQAIEKTLRRFSGWTTSIPVAGTRVTDKMEVEKDIAKSLVQMNYEERRLFIDQGHKLTSNISAILAIQSGSIAAMWRHVHEPNYNGRPEHIARDGKLFLMRDSWAIEKGFVKKNKNGYAD